MTLGDSYLNTTRICPHACRRNGERMRLACGFRRPAEIKLVKSAAFDLGEAPKPAREARALHNSYAKISLATLPWTSVRRKSRPA